MKYVIKPSVTLFVTAVIVTTLLSLVHAITLEPIERQLKKTQEAAMREVLPQASAFKEIPAEPSGSVLRVYEGSDSGGPLGYVVELAPEGYSGKINLMVGISSADEAVTGMRVLKHSETPGLGAQAVKENFYRQYEGKSLIPLKVVKTSPGDGEIDAITSATITSKAITDAVNEAIEWYNGGSWK